MNQVTESKSVESAEQMSVKGKVQKKSGNRIGYNYIILKSLKKSQKNDVVKCLYIKSLANFGICVIKEGTYGDSKDKHGRDITDRLMWQRQLHESLQGKIRLPRFLDSFEENGNFYLVLERIRGKSLYKTCREAGKDLRDGLIRGNKLGMKFLDYMVQLIELLEILHKHQIVHRDVTATNFMITPFGKVAVIDMELSYSLKYKFPSPPFTLGTYGYMSPEQEAIQMPSVEQDTFSVAAIILQIWTGISPIKLTNGPIMEIVEKVRFFIPDKSFADIIVACLDPDASKRPSLLEVRQTITRYKENLKHKTKCDTSIVKLFGRSEIIETIQQFVRAMPSSLFADAEKGWFSEDIKMPPNPDKKRINKTWYASFQKGASGIIYTLSKALTLGFEVEMNRSNIVRGLDLIKTKYIDRIDKVNPGLYFGGAGIAATIATAIQDGLIESRNEYFDWINMLLEKENQSISVQAGITGQGTAYWICNPFLHKEMIDKRLTGYVSMLLQSQESDGSWMTNATKKKSNRGFASGVAGITNFFLQFAMRYQHKEALAAAQKGLQWLIEKGIHQRNIIMWRSSRDKGIGPWLFDGAAGIALTFLRAYKLTNESKYKIFANKILQDYNGRILENNLSQSYGLSGLGEVYLEAFQILEDDQWLHRAGWITQVLMQLKKQTAEEAPYWLVAGERQPCAEFGTGNCGIIHFLMRYCFRGKIGFPLTAS